MKRIITIVLIVLTVFVLSCKNDKNSNENNSDTLVTDTLKNNSTNSDKEFNSKYICPNHCKGSGSENFGNCPVCGMEYIENFDYKQ